MEINISHNIDWWEGGIEIDEIIRGFCRRLNLKEGNYSKYTPCYLYLEYEDASMKQFNSLKRKLKNSKRLIKSKKGTDVRIEVKADNVY